MVHLLNIVLKRKKWILASSFVSFFLQLVLAALAVIIIHQGSIANILLMLSIIIPVYVIVGLYTLATAVISYLSLKHTGEK